MLELRAGPNGAVIDPLLGNIPEVWFGPIRPLHRAPWYGSRDDDAGIPPVERRLAGDFFAMPFGKSDLIGGPIHGPSANSEWDVIDRAPHKARLRLAGKIMGATVEKEVRIASGAPLIYQTHVIDGGKGAVPVAHHPMVPMAAGGRIACSAKRAVLVPEGQEEPGRRLLLTPGQRAAGLEALRGIDGSPLDLTHYPAAPSGDGFLTMVEAASSRLGWIAVTRAAEGDVVFILKDPSVLPVTMLWFSNGGRSAAPWNGRHTGVLGVEDGCAAGAAGHRGALAANAVSAEGVPTALELGSRHLVRHVIGAIPRPAGWSTVTRIRRSSGQLVLTGDDDTSVAVDFAAGFL